MARSGETPEPPASDLQHTAFQRSGVQLEIRVLHRLAVQTDPTLLDQSPGLAVRLRPPELDQEPGQPDPAVPDRLLGDRDVRHVLGDLPLPEDEREALLRGRALAGPVVQIHDLPGQTAL